MFPRLYTRTKGYPIINHNCIFPELCSHCSRYYRWCQQPNYIWCKGSRKTYGDFGETPMLCLWSMPGFFFWRWPGYFVSFNSSSSQEYSVNFQQVSDADSCHKFCGKNEDCGWWSFEPSQSMCMAFKNCTESGHPDTGACPDCISGERLYVIKCQLKLKTHPHVFYPLTAALQGNVMPKPNVMAIWLIPFPWHI